jgi:hypothetical protein
VGLVHTYSHFGVIKVTINDITNITNFIQIHKLIKSCTHPRNLNVNHYGIVEAMRLKNMGSRSLLVLSLRTKFHTNPRIGSKVIKGFVSLYPPQKLKRSPFWNDWSYEIKNVASKSSSMASPAYLISWKSTHWFKCYWCWTDSQTDIETGW